jgi:uncharacterized protein YegL
MPRMMNTDDNMVVGTVGSGAQAFKFSAIRIEHLGATEYTLVTIAIDVTGSTSSFAAELKRSLITAVDSCKKSPRAANLLLRVILFSSSLPQGIEEVHGFKPLADVDPSQYPDFQPNGMTPLYDAAFSAVGAVNACAKRLMDSDFLANGIVFVITDGEDNSSVTTPALIKAEMERGTQHEEIESLLGIVIGVNDAACLSALTKFATKAGMQYISGGDATKGKLAKLAAFVSQSISSTSQSLGTGGPSQNISATI